MTSIRGRFNLDLVSMEIGRFQVTKIFSFLIPLCLAFGTTAVADPLSSDVTMTATSGGGGKSWTWRKPIMEGTYVSAYTVKVTIKNDGDRAIKEPSIKSGNLDFEVDENSRMPNQIDSKSVRTVTIKVTPKQVGERELILLLLGPGEIAVLKQKVIVGQN